MRATHLLQVLAVIILFIFTTACQQLTVQVVGQGSVKSNSGTINCGNGETLCTAKYKEQTTEELIAEPAEGYELSHWEGCPYIGNYCLATTILFPISVKAVFSRYIDLFSPVASIYTQAARSVAVGDLNGDGLDDVVATFQDPRDYHQSLQFFFQVQDGSHQLVRDPSLTHDYATEDSNNQVFIADFDNDKRADVLVSWSGGIDLYRQTGSLSFTVETINTYYHEFLAIGDLNRDGLVDIVSIGWDDDEVEIYYGKASGGFDRSVIFATYDGWNDIEIGDLDHNGLLDIVVMSGQGASEGVVVLLQESLHQFREYVHYMDEATGLGIGDINGDHFDDIVVSAGGNRPASRIEIIKGGNPLSFDNTETLSSYDIPEPLIVADVNGDSRKDIVTLHSGWSNAGIYLQQQDNTLKDEELYYSSSVSHYEMRSLATGDVNGDGVTDLIFADYNFGISVLNGRP